RRPWPSARGVRSRGRRGGARLPSLPNNEIPARTGVEVMDSLRVARTRSFHRELAMKPAAVIECDNDRSHRDECVADAASYEYSHCRP
ncbi:MAG: hypothetical protein ACRDRT_14740, partial [Pseudonocardiaceae bacterium]